MATYESIQTATATNTNAVTVTKPTSLALSELMIAVISNGGKNDPATAATHAGWTQVSNTNDTTSGFALDNTVLAKVSDSADVAASDFTFSVTNTTDVVVGSIIRISGGFSTVGASEVDDSDSDGVGGSNTYTGGVTPNESNTLLIVGEATGGNNSNTHTGYAVANDNPSWTERADFGDNYDDGSSNDFLYMGIGTSTFAVGTATGNYTVVNQDSSVDNAHGFIISINESPVNVTVNLTPLIVTAILPEETVTGDANITLTPLIVTSTMPDVTVSTPENKWTEQSKNTPTWTNQSKS